MRPLYHPTSPCNFENYNVVSLIIISPLGGHVHKSNWMKITTAGASSSWFLQTTTLQHYRSRSLFVVESVSRRLSLLPSQLWIICAYLKYSVLPKQHSFGVSGSEWDGEKILSPSKLRTDKYGGSGKGVGKENEEAIKCFNWRPNKPRNWIIIRSCKKVSRTRLSTCQTGLQLWNFWL